MVDKKEDSRRVVYLDIETFANLSYTWGIYEQNVIDKEEEWFILSYAYKWQGESTTHVVSLPDFPGYAKDKRNDKKLVQSLWKIFNEADVIIAHNADFDIKKSCARFLFHGLPPPLPYKSICTKKLAKSRFKMDSNKLDHIGEYTGLGRKVKHEGFELWKLCRDGDQKAWGRMCKYNKQDVVLLEKIYLKMRPWSTNAPKLYFHADCQHCGSNNTEWRGTYYSKRKGGKRYQCRECGIFGHTFITNKK